MLRRCRITLHFSAWNWTTGSNSCRCSKKEVSISIRFVDVRARANRRISRNERLTDVHPRDARNRLRRSISSLHAPLVADSVTVQRHWSIGRFFYCGFGTMLLECRDFTGNQEWPKMHAGSVGLPSALAFDGRALAESQCTRLSTLPKASRSKKFGFTQARRTISQSIFTRVSALKYWVLLAIGRLGELWMIRTSC